MNTRTEKIYAALDQLCDALDLGRSESSTRLGLISQHPKRKSLQCRNRRRLRLPSGMLNVPGSLSLG
jgi:hypothetical protein